MNQILRAKATTIDECLTQLSSSFGILDERQVSYAVTSMCSTVEQVQTLGSVSPVLVHCVIVIVKSDVDIIHFINPGIADRETEQQ